MQSTFSDTAPRHTGDISTTYRAAWTPNIMQNPKQKTELDSEVRRRYYRLLPDVRARTIFDCPNRSGLNTQIHGLQSTCQPIGPFRRCIAGTGAIAIQKQCFFKIILQMEAR